jgi:hypothetical protein
MKYDLFISHASEDMESFVRPLAKALTERGVLVWYDEFELRPGSKLSRSIDRGLADSRHGLVVLSLHFFGKGWPERELGGLVARDVENPGVIIPIWHGVTKADVVRYSPPLADIVAIPTTDGPRSVALRLCETVCGPAQGVASQIRKAKRLLETGDSHTSVMAAAHCLEVFSKDVAVSRLGYDYFRERPVHMYSLGPLLRLLQSKAFLKRSKGGAPIDIDSLIRVRNQVIHIDRSVSEAQARWFVEAVSELIELNAA